MSESDQSHEQAHERATSLGVYDTVESDGLSQFEVVAAGATALWLLLGGAVLFFTGSADATVDETLGSLRLLVGVLVLILPAGLIWVAAVSLRAAHQMRTESQRLQSAIDAMRQTFVAQTQSHATGDDGMSVARKLDEIAAATRKTETVLATFTTRRDTPRTGNAEADEPQKASDAQQASLALGTRPEDVAPPLETDDFLRALNFPETADDEAGFAALRRAMQDRSAQQLIQAAQDALTLLSQDGIYMDDLIPDRARPEVWRQFAQGARGREIAALGGIRDRTALALAAGRMKQDPIFRDTAHHFLRRFDKTFADFEQIASDAEIQALAETRTARAFMLLGRIAGTFD